MGFNLSILFLFLYYIRPQDWVTGMAGFNIVRPVMLLWIFAAFTSRDRGPLPGLLRTPHDWLMLLYMGYVVWGSPDPGGAFNAFLPLVAFYALTASSLISWERVLKYLKAWNFMLLGIAILAVGSLYGFDLTGAVDATAQMEGRLSIGTWLHGNPNALGHSVVVAIPLSYLLYFWRGNVWGRLAVFPLCSLLAGMCVYHTESKGAYVVGGALVVLIFVIGRPFLVKAFALSVASTAGVSALSFLPRMSQMHNIKSEPGVLGRLMAWDLARAAMNSHLTGVGWKQFFAMIRWDGLVIGKSTHSSYIQVGADLGVIGITLFLSTMWASIRSLLNVHRITVHVPDWERSRRCALILVLAYLGSSWMINREYHTEYFLVVAVAAAIHRLNLAADIPDLNAETDAGGEIPERPRVGVRVRPGMNVALPQIAAPGDPEPEKPVVVWNRFHIGDVLVCAALTWVVLFVWDYVLRDL